MRILLHERCAMTRRQQQLLEFIKAFMEHSGGVSPSFNEMQAELGLRSKSGIHRILTSLEERGYIARHQRLARAISVRVMASPIVALERSIQDLEGTAGTYVTLEVLQTWVEIYRLKMPPAVEAA